MGKLKILFAAIVMTMAFSAEAQVNMSRKIEIVLDTSYLPTGVTPDILPRFILAADSLNTPVKIVCGSWDSIVYVDVFSNRFLDSLSFGYFYARDTSNHFYTVSIYGDVTFFSSRGEMALVRKYDFSDNDALRVIMCDSNYLCDSILLGYKPRLEALTFGYTNLGGIDIGGCPMLKMVGCHQTNFGTSAYEDLLCQLPACQPADSAKFFVSDLVIDTSFLSATSQNALSKNWTFYDRRNGVTTVQTTGTNICPSQIRRIRLKVMSGVNITLSLSADSNRSPIRIVSGNTDTTIIVDTNILWNVHVFADAIYMDVYGNVKTFSCSDNYVNIVGLDISQNPYLKRVDCYYTSISSIVFARINMLEMLYAKRCNLSTLDISSCQNLHRLDFRDNNISSIDLSNNPLLETLNCKGNHLTSLDISNNPMLYGLDCSMNRIPSLDISSNPDIKIIRCYGNGMSHYELDDLMCALPSNSSNDWLSHYLMAVCNKRDSSDAIYSTNVRNATTKHWSVFDSNYYSVYYTNGTFNCAQGVEIPEYNHLTITPNPAKGSVMVGGLEGETEIQIIDLQGKILKRQSATSGTVVIDIRELGSGIYFLKTDYSCDKLIVR